MRAAAQVKEFGLGIDKRAALKLAPERLLVEGARMALRNTGWEIDRTQLVDNGSCVNAEFTVRAPQLLPATGRKVERVYLAARYSRYPEMQGYARQLNELGVTVTSSWILGEHEAENDNMASIRATLFAEEDYHNLLDADTVISFTEPPRQMSTSRGGRHVELGMAIATGRRVIIVGHRENVFHHLPGIEYFPEWSGVLRQLADEREAA